MLFQLIYTTYAQSFLTFPHKCIPCAPILLLQSVPTSQNHWWQEKCADSALFIAVHSSQISDRNSKLPYLEATIFTNSKWLWLDIFFTIISQPVVDSELQLSIHTLLRADAVLYHNNSVALLFKLQAELEVLKFIQETASWLTFTWYNSNVTWEGKERIELSARPCNFCQICF